MPLNKILSLSMLFTETVNKVMLLGTIEDDAVTLDNRITLRITTVQNLISRNAKKELKESHSIIIPYGLLRFPSDQLCKGIKIYIEGKLQTTATYNDMHVKLYSTEIVAFSVQLM